MAGWTADAFESSTDIRVREITSQTAGSFWVEDNDNESDGETRSLCEGIMAGLTTGSILAIPSSPEPEDLPAEEFETLDTSISQTTLSEEKIPSNLSEIYAISNTNRKRNKMPHFFCSDVGLKLCLLKLLL